MLDSISIGLFLTNIFNSDDLFYKRILTFSDEPEWVNLSNCNSLLDSIKSILSFKWGSSTNLIKY